MSAKAGPANCDCCGASSSVIAIDGPTELCLDCQPCPECGRTGMACADRGLGRIDCDTTEDPNRPRRDFFEVMDDLTLPTPTQGETR